MAYAASGLKCFAPGAPFAAGTPPGNVANLYHYFTADAIATVVGVDYFVTEITRLKVGDVIICTCASGATLTTLVVATNNGTAITTVKTA